MKPYSLAILLSIVCTSATLSARTASLTAFLRTIQQNPIARFSNQSLTTDTMLQTILQAALTQTQDQDPLFAKLQNYVEPTLDQLNTNDPDLYAELSQPIIAYDNGTITLAQAQNQLSTLLENPMTALRLLYNINKLYNQDMEGQQASASSTNGTLQHQLQVSQQALGLTTCTSLLFGYMHMSRLLGCKLFWPVY